MTTKRKRIRNLIIWLIVAALLAALVIFVGIPMYTKKEVVQDNPPSISFYEGGTKTLTMENDQLKFEMDPKTTHFTVTEKANGRVWRSNPADASSDPIARTVNKEALDCTLIATYTVSSGEVGMNNYGNSISNQSYVITPLDDGSIDVEYSIGKIEKTYLIPKAITKVRFDEFTGQMSKSDVKKVKQYYASYSPEKLDSVKKKDELIAMYPEVQNQAIYVLKDDVKDVNKKKLETMFAGVGYNQDEYAIDMELVAGAKETGGPLFNVTVNYSLDDGDLLVTVPYEKLRYRNDYPLTYVSILPMFGAAGTEDEGFMLVPEGGGALIRYNNGMLSQTAYYANIYGWDFGTERREAVSETRDAFPVFGMTGNGGSFICIIEGATSYSGISADIAGRNNSYNTVYAKHKVLHFDRYNVSAKTPDLIYMYESEVPKDTITQRYRFVDSESYSEMARAYNNYLKTKVSGLQEKTASGDMPVAVEMIGAIDKKVVKFGMPVKSIIPTTTFQQAKDILRDFSDKGIRISAIMSGWCNGGINQKVLTGVHTLSQLGGEKGLKELAQAAREQGTDLYFDGITCFAYDSGIFDGFISFRDAARFTTREQVILYPYDIVTYQQQDGRDPYFLVKPSYARKNAGNLISKLSELNVQGVAFRDIGYLLSGDYYKSDTVTRETVKGMNLEVMQEAAGKGLKTAIRQGNDYAVPYSDLVVDMNLGGNPYAIIDEAVPFYQMALHGIVDYTGPAINVSGDYNKALLQCAEYGAGLYFCVMKEDTKVLRESNYSYLTSSGYDRWKDEILKMAERYQKEMAGLNTQTIVGHEYLTEFVAVTTYDNGTKVYVNYGDEDYTAADLTVPARDYAVERQD